jgi:hypothetical protein
MPSTKHQGDDVIAPPDPRRINDPEHWRDCAEQARAKAEHMGDPVAIATMVRVAEKYEGLARRAEASRSLSHLLMIPGQIWKDSDR